MGRSQSLSAIAPTPVQSRSLNTSAQDAASASLSVSQALSKTSIVIPPPEGALEERNKEEEKSPKDTSSSDVSEITEIKQVDEEGQQKPEPEEAELSTSAKIGAALKKVWAVVKKYTEKGLKKFINWLDEDGAKKDLSDDLLIVMEPSGALEPTTPRRSAEAEKKKSKLQRKLEHKSKYKSMIHLKAPTSSMLIILGIVGQN